MLSFFYLLLSFIFFISPFIYCASTASSTSLIDNDDENYSVEFADPYGIVEFLFRDIDPFDYILEEASPIPHDVSSIVGSLLSIDEGISPIDDSKQNEDFEYYDASIFETHVHDILITNYASIPIKKGKGNGFASLMFDDDDEEEEEEDDSNICDSDGTAANGASSITKDSNKDSTHLSIKVEDFDLNTTTSAKTTCESPSSPKFASILAAAGVAAISPSASDIEKAIKKKIKNKKKKDNQKKAANYLKLFPIAPELLNEISKIPINSYVLTYHVNDTLRLRVEKRFFNVILSSSEEEESERYKMAIKLYSSLPAAPPLSKLKRICPSTCPCQIFQQYHLIIPSDIPHIPGINIEIPQLSCGRGQTYDEEDLETLLKIFITQFQRTLLSPIEESIMKSFESNLSSYERLLFHIFLRHPKVFSKSTGINSSSFWNNQEDEILLLFQFALFVDCSHGNDVEKIKTYLLKEGFDCSPQSFSPYRKPFLVEDIKIYYGKVLSVWKLYKNCSSDFWVYLQSLTLDSSNDVCDLIHEEYLEIGSYFLDDENLTPYERSLKVFNDIIFFIRILDILRDIPNCRIRNQRHISTSEVDSLIRLKYYALNYLDITFYPHILANVSILLLVIEGRYDSAGTIDLLCIR